MVPKMPSIPRGFGFTEDHALLRESVRRFLAERFDRAALRRLHDGKGGRFEISQLAELGWLALTAAEEHGGAGLGWLHAALLAEELGRALFPHPVSASILAAELAARAGEGALVGQIARGELRAALVFDLEEGVPAGVDVVLARSMAAAGVDAWVGIDLREGGVERTAERSVDPTRPAERLRIAGARARRLAVDVAAADAALLPRALVLLAAESCGAAEVALAMTRDYACERQQFGRPIGSYQAVSHPIVNTLIEVEQARSLTLAAAAALDTGAEDVETLARMAKAAASEALTNATARGVQAHGGFGFTWDCDMHFYFRRAVHDRGALGDPLHHRAFLAKALFAGA
jgi:alkylation response protein AidB-like acyl-CoA dehydrogenase